MALPSPFLLDASAGCVITPLVKQVRFMYQQERG